MENNLNRQVERIAAHYVERFGIRAHIIVRDNISRAIGGGRWGAAGKWIRIRNHVLALQGIRTW